MKIDHIISLISGHYSMLCSIFVGILLFAVSKIVSLIRGTNKGQKDEYSDNDCRVQRLLAMAILEICGFILFTMMSMLLYRLDFSWGSAILAGAYAIAMDEVIRQAGLGVKGLVLISVTIFVASMIFILVWGSRGDHFQLCVLIKLFSLLEAMVAGCNVILGILKSGNKETK